MTRWSLDVTGDLPPAAKDDQRRSASLSLSPAFFGAVFVDVGKSSRRKRTGKIAWDCLECGKGRLLRKEETKKTGEKGEGLPRDAGTGRHPAASRVD
ncbi:hypothetical protein L596_006156 [Steinernema carpocapsae]|uniref:Uncharacterized protein n=1 Tax=Steinernema carpocapsae TaxID=34508 RepID=A0A4U8V2U8_STECR|nr:hypothetical protein L596_006156 [Steinernema carpocapsae]